MEPGLKESELRVHTNFIPGMIFNSVGRGIEVVYTDGSRRGIGPGRVAMQYYSIDGPGDERIIACYPRRDPSDDRISWWSLRFITNRTVIDISSLGTGHSIQAIQTDSRGKKITDAF